MVNVFKNSVKCTECIGAFDKENGKETLLVSPGHLIMTHEL